MSDTPTPDTLEGLRARYENLRSLAASVAIWQKENSDIRIPQGLANRLAKLTQEVLIPTAECRGCAALRAENDAERGRADANFESFEETKWELTQIREKWSTAERARDAAESRATAAEQSATRWATAATDLNRRIDSARAALDCGHTKPLIHDCIKCKVRMLLLAPGGTPSSVQPPPPPRLTCDGSGFVPAGIGGISTCDGCEKCEGVPQESPPARRPLDVRDLIEKLLTMPKGARVLFDTEGTDWQVHCIPVDYCHYEPEAIDAVVLSTALPHGGGAPAPLQEAPAAQVAAGVQQKGGTAE